MVIRLSQAFGGSPDSWLQQLQYDLWQARQNREEVCPSADSSPHDPTRADPGSSARRGAVVDRPFSPAESLSRADTSDTHRMRAGDRLRWPPERLRFSNGDQRGQGSDERR